MALKVSVPEDQRAQVRGIEGGSLRVTLELAKVNGDQHVSAPAKTRPIADLSKQLGGLGALRQGLPGALRPEDPAPPEDPRGAPGRNPDADALKRYSACLDKAPPSDTEAITRCRDLLD
jgi:hypothetical protein